MMDAAYPIGFIGLGTMGQAMALPLVKEPQPSEGRIEAVGGQVAPPPASMSARLSRNFDLEY